MMKKQQEKSLKFIKNNVAKLNNIYDPFTLLGGNDTNNTETDPKKKIKMQCVEDSKRNVPIIVDEVGTDTDTD